MQPGDALSVGTTLPSTHLGRPVTKASRVVSPFPDRQAKAQHNVIFPPSVT